MKAAMRATIPVLMLALGCGASHGDGDDGGTTGAPRVGPACLPESIPAGGYSGLEVYLETSSASCETRTCLVYHLDGDPTMLDCDGPGCVSSAEAAARSFCTCRCSSDVEGSPLCECPEGFECVDDLIAGGPGIAGGYCVREGI
jgi:hypothetical protein